MSDEDALLAAISAHPDDDTARLVYADWLDEHGRPERAEFIRVQIEIARKEHLPRAVLNRYVDLFRRQQELIEGHRAALLGPLAGLPASARPEFRRGFLERVELPVDDFLAHSAALAAAGPAVGVRVTGVLRRLHSFLTCPDVGCVTELSGYADQTVPGELRLPDDLVALDAADRLRRLAVLDLEGCGVDDLYCDLAFNFPLPALRDLDLSNNFITDRGVEDLLRTDLPRTLTRLILGGNDITDAGALALARDWPRGADDRLETLNLRFTNVGQPGQAALLNRFGGRVDLF